MPTKFRSRNEIVGQTEGVNLKALFRGPDGNPSDLDQFPTISIIQPSGNVLLGPTSSGVYKISTGLYGYDFVTAYNTNIGVWTDCWEGVLSGLKVVGTFIFVVHNTQLPAINTDGYAHLGDDPGYCYSQDAIKNINWLVRKLKSRLNSSGKAYSKDQYGNPIYVDCDIFSPDSLIDFLELSLSSFNEIPHTTGFTFDDVNFVRTYGNVIVQGALYMALASKALIERGAEFNLSDNGVSFAPPGVSDLLNSQYSSELANHIEKIKAIKASMKPSPLGLGSFTLFGNSQPMRFRLQHLRRSRLV